MKSVSISIDKTAIGLSLLCAAHCLLLPVVLIMVPSFAANTFVDERFHLWMLIAVLPTSLLALTLGCKQHRNISVILMGLLGLTTLTMAALFGHDLMGETGEKVVSLIGASIIALSHLRNHTLCKHHQCHCETHSV
jgi:EamA domain-containing membrane protein RarD